MTTPTIICLMGPTASGKTPLAIELVQQFPCEIISVDSALVYKGMDIGTAKPTSDILRIAPHRLIDIIDPKDSYSAGRFIQDALREIEDILAKGKVPLLVGGTMLYFRVLQQGLATLPKADAALRATFLEQAKQQGWQALHATLAQVDPEAAKRIAPQDSQRIQRALEVHRLTGQALSTLQVQETSPLSRYRVCNLALMPQDRSRLHAAIAERFKQMLAQGFVDEVKGLYERGDLTSELPSIRSVGYRQMWAYLDGLYTYNEMQEKAIAATRQLAKRQMTWLRSWSELTMLDAGSSTVSKQAVDWLAKHL